MREFCLKTINFAIEHSVGDPYIIGAKAIEWCEKGYLTQMDLADIQARLFPEGQGDNNE